MLPQTIIEAAQLLFDFLQVVYKTWHKHNVNELIHFVNYVN